MNQLVGAWQRLLATDLFGVALTLACYAAAAWVWRRGRRHPLLTPAFVSIAAVVAILLLTGSPYEQYWAGARYLNFLLGPATVALAVPLHRARATIRAAWLSVGLGVLAGAVTGIVAGVWVVRWFGGDDALAVTVAPKSATTPIAMALSAAGGGNGALTAVLTVLTGGIGAVLALPVLGLLRIRDPRVRGLAMGVSSHGIGTARALEEGPVTGAFSALAMALSGLTTALLFPFLLAALA